MKNMPWTWSWKTTLSRPERKASVCRWIVTVISLINFGATRETCCTKRLRNDIHTFKLTSQVACCVRMRTAISLFFFTARCNGEPPCSLPCTLGSKPLLNKNFNASPVLSLIWGKKKFRFNIITLKTCCGDTCLSFKQNVLRGHATDPAFERKREGMEWVMEGSEKVSQGSQSVSRKDGNEGGAKRTCFF